VAGNAALLEYRLYLVIILGGRAVVRALDSKTGIALIEALLGINVQLATTTLIITHNAAIQAVADRVLSFADGQISAIRKNETRRPVAEISW
jgi:putative ABC transport system ATP-binding protein